MSRETYDKRGVALGKWFKESGFTRLSPEGLLEDYYDVMTMAAIAYCCVAKDKNTGEEYEFKSLVAKVAKVVKRLSDERGYSIGKLSGCDGDETISVLYYHKDLLEDVLIKVGADPELLPVEGESPSRDLIATIAQF